MRNDLARLLLAVLVLVAGGVAEELLPKFSGVGFPVLLTACVLVAARRPAFESSLFAVAAGAFEDALSALPPATSIGYFLGVAALARFAVGVRSASLVGVLVYQLWLALWLRLPGATLFVRLLLAVPIGSATVLAVERVLRFLERRAALDEE